MNKIAELGKLLIEYQDYVETGLIILGVVIVIALIVKAVNKSRERHKLLNQINDTVTDINSKVDNINNKSTEVIYIDNRDRKTEEKDRVESADVPEAEESGQNIEGQETEEHHEDTENENIEEVTKEIPKKFTGLECNVSKKGREYTLEELIEQIKE